MGDVRKLEHRIIVFCNWAVFGFLGLGFLAEGAARDVYLIGLIGVIGVVAGFTGHIVINFVFQQSFSKGETALGLAVFSLSILTFVLNWLFVGYSDVDVLIGLTFFATLVLGFFIYVVTRYGVRGAFNRFDVKRETRSGRKE